MVYFVHAARSVAHARYMLWYIPWSSYYYYYCYYCYYCYYYYCCYYYY